MSRALPRARRAPGPALAVAAGALLLAGCGAAASGASHRSTTSAATKASTATTATSAASRQTTAVRTAPPPPSYPQLNVAATAHAGTSFAGAVRWQGRTAAWLAQRAPAVALLRFDQRLVRLELHSGTTDAGATGWKFGPEVTQAEKRTVIAGFNGGFKLATGAGGFFSYGRTAVPLRDGLGSVVTYADGHTDIGAWNTEVPAAGQRVVSVRQNLTLLVDHGAPAGSTGCLTCWGATLGGVSDPARSGLGITADGQLIWAGGEHLTPAELASALIGARAVRAVELDINPAWVAAYLYGHRGGRGPLAPVPIVPGQPGVPGQFLVPYSRDFFTIVAR